MIPQIAKFLNKPDTIPDYLSQGRLVLLSKTESSFPKINDTRPLVVETIITKIMEKAIMSKLKCIDAGFVRKREYQKGFTEGESTISNITKLLLITQN